MITGRVYDSATNEDIWNANIYISDATGLITAQAIGTTSWFDGSYSLDTKGATGYITCSIVGYAKRTFPITEIGGIGQRNFAMTKTAVELPEVEIIDKKITWFDKNKYLLLTGSFLAAIGFYLRNKNRK